MKPSLGYLDWEGKRWFITKVRVESSFTSGNYVVLSLRLHKSKEKKEIYIHKEDILWSIVEQLQKKYPSASYWKTKSQRWKAHLNPMDMLR